MKIYEFIKEKNKKVSIKTSRVLGVKKHYLSLYRAEMVKLYDEGYISDPTNFNRREITENIINLGIRDVISSSGKVMLDSEYVGYALAKASNPESRKFLSLLCEALRYREISSNIDRFYDDNEFSSDTKRKVSLNLMQSASRIYNRSGYTHDEGTLQCFIPFGSSIEYVSLRETIYDIALEELGLLDKRGTSSLFVKGLTVNDEIRYSALILNGLVALDGEYADILINWLRDNKWSDDSKFSHQKEGLYNWIVFYKTNRMIDEQANLLQNLTDSGNTIVSMDTTGCFILSLKDVLDVPIGIFCVSSTDEGDEVLPERNILEGYTGEVRPLSYLVDNGINFVGCPIELYADNKTTDLFIDIEQTEFKETKSFFETSGATIEFHEEGECDELKYHNSFEKNSLEGVLSVELAEAEKGHLIGEIPSNITSKDFDLAKKELAKVFYK